MPRKDKKQVLCGGCALLLAVLLAAVSVAEHAAACREVRTDVLRLHVIANSDSEMDQQVKLKVRDALLTIGGDLLDGTVTAAEAEKTLGPHLNTLEETANAVLAANGCGYGAKAEVTNEYFDARAYGDITLPAGNYTALKVVLGEGAGRNWWCVMFPPLCLPAAEPKDAIDLFTAEERAVLSPAEGYEVRLKLAEWLQLLWEKIENRQQKGAQIRDNQVSLPSD